MINWSLLDLKGALTLLRADPVSFSPEALEAMASLCEPKADTWENVFRWVLRAWPLQKDKLPYEPRWIQVDNHYPTGSLVCGTEEECALLRAILHTAAQLRREEKLGELSNLADAAHNFPAMIAERDRHALRYVRKELLRIRQSDGVLLLPPPPPDGQATLEKIMPFAGKCSTTGGKEP